MSKHAFRILPLVLALILCSEHVLARVRYVDAGAAPGGDGSSWTKAMNDLSTALSTASSTSVAEVRVAEGRYAAPTSGFVLPTNVSVYGGFVGTETSLDQRDPRLHPTVLDGDAIGDDQPNWIGYDDNASHAVVDTGGPRTHSDGFTVRGGRGSPGAGLFLVAREVTLASDLGLLMVSTANVVARQCTFSNAGVPAASLSLGSATLDLAGCIVWGDAPEQLALFLTDPGGFKSRWAGAPSSVQILVPPGVSGLYHAQAIVASGIGAVAFSNYVPLQF